MQRHLVRRFKIISGGRGEAEASVNKLLSDPKVENIIRIGDTIVKYGPPKEMTIEEIEEKLGYKVKVVSREDE